MPRLKLKWAYGFDGDIIAFSEPSVLDGNLFVGSASGLVQALSAESGCVRWVFQANGPVRTALPAVASGNKHALLFGDATGWFYAIEAETGKLLWKKRPEPHEAARLTGAAAVYQGTVFVPVASWEESRTTNPDHPCCTFRGSGPFSRCGWRAHPTQSPRRPVELMRPVFRDPDYPVLVDGVVMRSRHRAVSQGKRVFGEGSRARVHLGNVTRLMAGEPDVALPIQRGIMQSQQLFRQFVFGNDDPSRLAPGARKNAERRILRIGTADPGEKFDQQPVFGVGVRHLPVAHGNRGAAEMHHAVHHQSPAVFVITTTENLLPGVAPGAIFL